MLVKRGIPRCLVLRCPCGCGDDLVVNLDPRTGDAWRFFRRKRGLSVYPSYWRETACASHFIIWNDSIIWCDWKHGQDPEYTDPILRRKIIQAVEFRDWVDHRSLATELDEIPWDVLWAARKLVREGILEEGEKIFAGWFRTPFRNNTSPESQ